MISSEELKKTVKPLMELLRKEGTPMMEVRVTQDDAAIYEASVSYVEEFED